MFWAFQTAARRRARWLCMDLLLGIQKSWSWVCEIITAGVCEIATLLVCLQNSCCWVATGAKLPSPFLGTLSQITTLGLNARSRWIWVKSSTLFFSLFGPMRRCFYDQSECSDSDPNPVRLMCKGGGPPAPSVHEPLHFRRFKAIFASLIMLSFTSHLWDPPYIAFLFYFPCGLRSA